MAYVQLKAGIQSAITERYIHAAQVLFPGAAARGEERCSEVARKPIPSDPIIARPIAIFLARQSAILDR